MSGTETDITERSPEMSGYELRRVLLAVAELVERVPELLRRELQQAAQDGIEDTTVRIAQVLDAVKIFEETIDAKTREIAVLYDKLWEATKAAAHRTEQRIAELPKMPTIEFPHALKDIVDIAKRLDGLTDAQWKHVIELAKSLATTAYACTVWLKALGLE